MRASLVEVLYPMPRAAYSVMLMVRCYDAARLCLLPPSQQRETTDAQNDAAAAVIPSQLQQA